MKLVRRQFLGFAGTVLALPVTSRTILAQAPQAGPKLTQILKSDLQGQGQKVEETVVNTLEVPPGAATPWHMHPAAQEILFVVDGDLTVEVDGQGTKLVRAGEITLVPAEIPHLVRNESGSALVKALVTYSRGDKAKPFLVLVKRAT